MERQGFTLVELLIVITLIGLLAGLLFPVLTAAFDAGNNITCQNNLKEIASAVLAHASQHHGRIPPAVVLEPGDDTVGVWWCNLLVQRGYISAENTVGLDGRTEEPTVLLCPAGIDKRVTWATNPESPADDDAQGWARLGNVSRTADCSYYWNGSWQGESAYRAFPSIMVEPDQDPKGFTHNLSEIRRRTRLVMVTDGVWTNAISAGSRGRIAARHPGSYGRRCRTNIVFYDGHVEQYEWDEDYEGDPGDPENPGDPLWKTEDLRAFAKDVENQSITLVFRLDDQEFKPEEEEEEE